MANNEDIRRKAPIAYNIGRILKILGYSKSPDIPIYKHIGGPATGAAIQSLLLGSIAYALAKRFVPDKALPIALAAGPATAIPTLAFFLMSNKKLRNLKDQSRPMSFLEMLNYDPYTFSRELQSGRWSIPAHMLTSPKNLYQIGKYTVIPAKI